jgi:hypothetical protein
MMMLPSSAVVAYLMPTIWEQYPTLFDGLARELMRLQVNSYVSMHHRLIVAALATTDSESASGGRLPLLYARPPAASPTIPTGGGSGGRSKTPP